MAKKSIAEKSAGAPSTGIDGVPYEVHDAYHTLKRAHHIVGDKALMGKVKNHAAEMAKESQQVSHQAGMLAKMGKISTKALAKMRV